MHTPLCGHALGTPGDFINSAKAKGMSLITFTCHVPFDHPEFGGPRIRMNEDDFPQYVDWVARARELGMAHGVDVLFGIEGEIFPDKIIQNKIGDFIKNQSFDYVLGSLHHQLSAYKQHLELAGRKSDPEIIEGYFNELCEGAKSGLFHSLAHPDVIRIYGTVEPFEPENYESSIKTFLRTCAQTGTCIEVNTSGLTKGIYKLHPDPLILRWALEEGVDLTIGSDSHKPDSVGQYFDTTLKLIQETGFQSVHYFIGGQKQAVPVEAMIQADKSIVSD